MAAPTTSLGSVTVRKLNSVISALWTKIKNSFAPKDDGLATHDTSKFYRADGTWAAPPFDKVVIFEAPYSSGANTYPSKDMVKAAIDAGKYPVIRVYGSATSNFKDYYFETLETAGGAWKMIFRNGTDILYYYSAPDSWLTGTDIAPLSSGVVPIAKLPTASSVTDGDTTHVPTVDAVYDALAGGMPVTQIGSTNVDLNDYKGGSTVKFYMWSAGDATRVANKPFSDASILTVYPQLGSDGRARQVCYRRGAQTIATREFIDANSGWTTWREIALDTGTYPNMTVGNVSNVVPIAKLPTANSVTDGDTTHVPTVDAVYDYAAWSAKGKGNVAVITKPLEETWSENNLGIFDFEYAVNSVIASFRIVIRCEGSISSSAPFGTSGFVKVLNRSTGTGSNFVKYRVEDGLLKIGFRISSTERVQTITALGQYPATIAIATGALTGWSDYTPTTFYGVFKSGENSIGSSSRPVYVMEDGSMAACYVGRQTTRFANTKGYLKIAEFTVTDTTNVNTWYKVNLKFISSNVGDIIYERTMFFNKRSGINTVYYKESHSPISGSPTIQLQLYATSSTKVTLYAYIASETLYSILVSDVEGGGWNNFYSGEELSSNVTLYNNETPSSTTPSGTLITPTT